MLVREQKVMLQESILHISLLFSSQLGMHQWSHWGQDNVQFGGVDLLI